METKIENIGFSEHQLKLLLDNGYYSVEDICKADKEKLISCVGKQSYYSIKRKLHQIGLFFEFENSIYEKIKISLKNGMEIHYELLDLGQPLASSFVNYLLTNYNKETFNYKDIINLSIDELVRKYTLGKNNILELFFIVHMLDLKLEDEIKGKIEEEIPEYRKIIKQEETKRNQNKKLNDLLIINRLSKTTLEKLKMFGYETIGDICNVNYQDFVTQIEDKDMIDEIIKLLIDFGLKFSVVDNANEIEYKFLILLSKLEEINISNSLKQQKLTEYRNMILQYQQQVIKQADLESSLNRMSESATELRYIEKRLELLLK